MNRLPTDKRDKIILLAAGTVAVMVGLWFLLISPLRVRLAALEKEAEDSRHQVSRGQSMLAATQQVVAELQSASNRLAMAEGAMGSGDLYAWMIQTLNQFKTTYHVDIPPISREIPCEVGVFPQFPYKAAAFLVRGTAYYHDFGKFLADFENSFPYMRVQNLELEPLATQKNEESERLQFKMELLTLIKPATL